MKDDEQVVAAIDAGRVDLTGVDRTEEKRAQDQAQAVQAKFERILAMASDGIISIDADQRIIVFNRGAEDIFGYSAAEVLGRPLDMLIPPRFRAAHREHVKRFGDDVVESRRMGERHSNFWGLRKDGEEFYAQVAISKVDIAGERIYTAVLRDATESRRGEEETLLLSRAGAELARSLDYEETLSRVADLATVSLADFCIVDLIEGETVRRLRAVHRNPAKRRLAEAFQTIQLDRNRPHLAWEVIQDGKAVLQSHLGEGYIEAIAQSDYHLRLLRELAPTSHMAVPLTARGRRLGVLLFLATTPHRHFDRQDLHVAEALAERAAMAIDNARLYEERQRAIDARDHLMAVVAHDLRNPLTSVQLATQLLADEIPPGEAGEEARRRVASILTGVSRSLSLIDDLLQISQIEAEGLSVMLEPRDAVGLLHEAYDAFAVAAKERGIDLRIRGEVRARVMADEERVMQILSNLVGNALKFTPSGGRVVLSAEERDEDVVFSVADTGPGIALENHRRVFDRFWQAGRSGRHRGAGLGLPIAKGLLEAHGGRIWLESAPGKGSTFFFTLRRAQRQAVGDAGSIPTRVQK